MRAIGYVWLALFFVGNLVFVPGVIGELIRFFSSNLIFPILLIFAGAVLRRRARTDHSEQGSSRPRPSDLPPTSSGPSPAPSPSRTRPKPMTAKPSRSTAAVHRREMEEMARAHQGIQGDKPEDHMKAVEEILDKEMSYKPKSSEEMIAEARRRWNREV